MLIAVLYFSIKYSQLVIWYIFVRKFLKILFPKTQGGVLNYHHFYLGHFLYTIGMGDDFKLTIKSLFQPNQLQWFLILLPHKCWQIASKPQKKKQRNDIVEKKNNQTITAKLLCE